MLPFREDASAQGLRQGTRESPAQLWGGSVVRAYDGSVRLHSILLHSSHIVRALSRWYEVCLTTSTQEETTEHCPVYPTSDPQDPRIPAEPAKLQLHLGLRRRRDREDDVDNTPHLPHLPKTSKICGNFWG